MALVDRKVRQSYLLQRRHVHHEDYIEQLDRDIHHRDAHYRYPPKYLIW